MPRKPTPPPTPPPRGEFDDEQDTPVIDLNDLLEDSTKPHKIRVARETLLSVGDLGDRVDALDQRVSMISSQTNLIARTQTGQGLSINRLAGKVSTMSETNAKLVGQLDLLVDDYKLVKHTQAQREMLAAETDAAIKKTQAETRAAIDKAEADNKIDADKARRTRILKIIGIIGTVLAAVIAAITAS